MARKVFEVAGQKYIVIAYTGFAELGLATEPPRPLAAVPLFDRVEDSLVEPLRRARSVEEDFKVMGFRGVGGLLRAMAGESVASAPPQGNGRLSYEDKSVCPFVLFRGERSYEFSIMPTSYRPLAHIPAERHPRIRRRHTRIERRLARKIRAAVLISRRSWLTRLQSRAAAATSGPSVRLWTSLSIRAWPHILHTPHSTKRIELLRGRAQDQSASSMSSVTTSCSVAFRYKHFRLKSREQPRSRSKLLPMS